jgi:hypothetical protein
MSLYDAIEPKKSVDLLTEYILTSNRVVYCHFFMECGNKSTQMTTFQGKQINVCNTHFIEIKNS